MENTPEVQTSENSIRMPSSDDKLEHDERQVVDILVLSADKAVGLSGLQ